MPPQLDKAAQDAYVTSSPITKIAKQAIDNEHSKNASAPRRVFFRIGSLRFGVHGIAGIVAYACVSYSLVLKRVLDVEIPFWLQLAVVFSSLTAAFGSYDLLSQVPNTSTITSWIFPPHRDAFKRTIAIVGYLIIRLVREWHWFFFSEEGTLFPLLLFGYVQFHFFPFFKADISNGNTWVFVYPMFLGFSVDACHLFPTSLTEEGRWNKSRDWRQNRVDENYLLWTLWNALGIAFMFTVAFRGHMSIKTCYWIAAVLVGILCIGLFR